MLKVNVPETEEVVETVASGECCRRLFFLVVEVILAPKGIHWTMSSAGLGHIGFRVQGYIIYVLRVCPSKGAAVDFTQGTACHLPTQTKTKWTLRIQPSGSSMGTPDSP